MVRNFLLVLFALIQASVGLWAQGGVIDQVVSGAVASLGEKKLLANDSIDFQFAISLNDGAGFFDIEQKGETFTKFLYSAKPREQFTALDMARDSLEKGIGMYRIRRYEMAERKLIGARNLMERHRLTNQILYLRILSNLGLIYLTQGKTNLAGQYLDVCLENSKENLGTTSAAYVANLNNKAKLHQVLGEFNQAEKSFQDAGQLGLEVFGGGMQQAIILNNQAMLSQTMGRTDDAVRTMNEAIRMSGEAPKFFYYGAKSFDNRKFLANLGTIQQSAGNYEEAERIFVDIKGVFESKRQTKSAEYAGLCHQLGLLYIQMGKYDQVKELLETSLSVYKKRWTEKTIYYAAVADDMGNFYRLIAQYKDADNWLHQAFDIRKELLNETHPDYINSQEHLATLYWKTGKVREAHALYRDVMTKTMEIINRYFPPMSESEKTKFWDITQPRFQQFYQFAAENHQAIPELKSAVFNSNVATKGLLLNATSKVRSEILSSGDEQLIADYLNWKDQKEQLARLYSYSKNKLKKQGIGLAAMEREANALERSLSQRSGSFSDAYITRTATLTEIKSKLKPGECLVDIIRMQQFDQEFTDDVRYVALVLTPGSEHPEWITLPNGQELESRFLNYYRSAIRSKVSETYTYDQFWKYIDQQVPAGSRIYYVPDGVFNQLNINTLRLPEGKFLVQSHELVLLGNSADLIELHETQSSLNKSAFLLGYADYQTEAIPMLPGTRQEVDDISVILEDAAYDVHEYVLKDASEENVKGVQNPRIMHIATHGFFMEDAVYAGRGSVLGVRSENAAKNPLLRSGLILAGTGPALRDTSEVNLSGKDNGILTAYEAMNLNLDQTELVVLSACETGLGEVKAGEGVYGLQRSFQVAGADAIIMSLWVVDDYATQKLMSHFYREWVTSGNKLEAFRNAQLQLMTEYEEPYYWGAFVMIGS